MSESKRVFFLEAFGGIPARVGYHLMHNREKTLVHISRSLGLQKKTVAKALSLLIHFGVVGFNNFGGRGFRYLVKESYTHLINNPVYLQYLERAYGAVGLAVGAEMLLQGRLKGSDIPEDMVQVSQKMVQEGVLTENVTESKEVKKIRMEESRDFGAKVLRLSKEKVKERILGERLEQEIEKKFSKQTKIVFAVVRHFYPTTAPFKAIAQRVAMFDLQEDFGMSGVEGMTLEDSVRSHLAYLVAYGAISGSFEKYQLNYEWCVRNLKLTAVLDYCEMHISAGSSSLLALLLSKGYVEDRFLQKHILMDPAQSKSLLFALLSEGLVSTQMVSRTTECLPSKSFHFWHASTSKIFFMLISGLGAKISDCYLELEACKESAEVLPKQEYRHRLETLYKTLESLHLFYFTLGL
ncbi:hypothetical protein NEDG_00569 [Nematocida displodere]|uniref:DNA-directed RNA polymerase III subunit RPC3 n=1 Tax=Nematocida displodere TaxID=1805483 RepID=A0A177ECH9_9MICR|nr:hypothetical protein NEDG_00569 [Nematocida displodere]